MLKDLVVFGIPVQINYLAFTYGIHNSFKEQGRSKIAISSLALLVVVQFGTINATVIHTTGQFPSYKGLIFTKSDLTGCSFL